MASAATAASSFWRQPTDPTYWIQPFFVRADLTIKSARTKKGCIQYVGSVGCRQNDDAAVAAEAIHFHQQLIQRTFSFIITHNGILASRTAYGVNLIDE